MTKRIALVLDVSGSMSGEPLEQAQREVLTIMSLFPDDGEVRVYAFSGGVAEFEAEKGWHKLPDGLLLDRAAKWLAGFVGVGTTDIGGGVAAALANPEDDLSVVLVTDGEPTIPYAAHAMAIEKAQAARKAGQAPVHVIGVRRSAWDTSPQERKFCEAVASRNGGSLLLLEPAAPPGVAREPH